MCKISDFFQEFSTFQDFSYFFLKFRFLSKSSDFFKYFQFFKFFFVFFLNLAFLSTISDFFLFFPEFRIFIPNFRFFKNFQFCQVLFLNFRFLSTISNNTIFMVIYHFLCEISWNTRHKMQFLFANTSDFFIYIFKDRSGKIWTKYLSGRHHKKWLNKVFVLLALSLVILYGNKKKQIKRRIRSTSLIMSIINLPHPGTRKNKREKTRKKNFQFFLFKNLPKSLFSREKKLLFLLEQVFLYWYASDVKSLCISFR